MCDWFMMVVPRWGNYAAMSGMEGSSVADCEVERYDAHRFPVASEVLGRAGIRETS